MDGLAQDATKDAVRVPSRPLTTREREVLGMLANGFTGEQIAELLFLSPETVQKHVHNAKRKLGAATRAHMIALAIKHGVIDPG